MKTFNDLITPEMKTIAVVCNQWGDTGKGKFVDYIAQHWADIIARGTGGDNAGHTVILNDQEHIFHLLPSSILHDKDGKINIIGSGVVIYPKTLCDEIKLLLKKGFSLNNLQISLRAKLTLPTHILQDRLKESLAGKEGGEKIGTTGKGITPTYLNHVGRSGLIMNDLLNTNIFIEKIKKHLREVRVSLKGYDLQLIREILNHDHLENGIYFSETDIINEDTLISQYLKYAKELDPFIRDTDSFLRSMAGKKNILLEGAQGHLLSIDYGTYPYVTSSDCTVPGLAKGVGLKESCVDLELGIIKGFCMSKVGEGPFPTEHGGKKSEEWCRKSGRKALERQLFSSGRADINSPDPFLQGIAIRVIGEEYGSTTGRPRRIGWLDLPLLRHAFKTSHKNLILTKLDILSGVKKIKVCYAYRYKGVIYRFGEKRIQKGDVLRTAISDANFLKDCEPLFKVFPGWEEDISGVRDYQNLPLNLRKILDYLTEETGAKNKVISVGPKPEQTIIV